jgi:hypothetical protein
VLSTSPAYSLTAEGLVGLDAAEAVPPARDGMPAWLTQCAAAKSALRFEATYQVQSPLLKFAG